MEFVPSFGICTSSQPTAEEAATTAPPDSSDSQILNEASTPEAQTPDDVSPTQTENEPQQSVTVAAPTDPITDKSPGKLNALAQHDNVTISDLEKLQIS